MPKTKLTKQDIQMIRELSKIMSQKAIALLFEIDPSLVSKILKGHRHAEKA